MCPHGRNLVNMIEPSIRCSDAALCQITLTTCLQIQLCVGALKIKVNVLTLFCWLIFFIIISIINFTYKAEEQDIVNMHKKEENTHKKMYTYFQNTVS